MTRRIVDALKIGLSASEQAGIPGPGTGSIETHERFMRMRSRLLSPGLTAEQGRGAMAAGERAVALDPGYAQACAVLGVMQVLDFHNQWSGRPAEAAMAVAEGCVERALELAPEGVPPNHAAAVTAFWRRDLARAETCIGKVLAAAPDYALGIFTRGKIKMGRGRFAAAIPDFERATRLDPAARHQHLRFLAMSHFPEAHFETAVLMFREGVSLAPNTDAGRAWLASALGHVGEGLRAAGLGPRR